MNAPPQMWDSDRHNLHPHRLQHLHCLLAALHDVLLCIIEVVPENAQAQPFEVTVSKVLEVRQRQTRVAIELVVEVSLHWLRHHQVGQCSISRSGRNGTGLPRQQRHALAVALWR